jgi:hypothetical protein
MCIGMSFTQGDKCARDRLNQELHGAAGSDRVVATPSGG